MTLLRTPRRVGLAALLGLLVVLAFGMTGSDEDAQAAWRQVIPADTSGSAAAQPPTAYEIGVMSFNVCGGVCRHGEVAWTAGNIADAALEHRASAVMLQELCYSQYVRVISLLEPRGFIGYFASQRDSRTCANDDASHGKGFGVGVLTRGPISDPVVRRLPTVPGVEGRLFLGVTTMLAGRSTFVASLHLSPSLTEGRDRQLAAVADLIGPLTDRPAIIGGDFNTLADDPGLGRYYSPSVGGSGGFTELDETRNGNPEKGGSATFADRKIDYVFLSTGHFTAQRAESIPNRFSDHRLYVGTVEQVSP
ncbi:endonuclease/exonuclease/phosphatase family protein [Micromonosporaceae bacterium Da 78-11]